MTGRAGGNGRDRATNPGGTRATTGLTGEAAAGATASMLDPRGVRVTLLPGTSAADPPPIVVEPPAIPVAPAPRLAGAGLLGGVAIAPTGGTQSGNRPDAGALETDASDERDLGAPAHVLVDGVPCRASLRLLDGEHAVLQRDGGVDERLLLLPAVANPGGGARRREIVVGGWRIEVEVEPAARAALRERARRGREEAGHSGPTEVHAIIPGVIVAVSVEAGDQVVAGQQLLVVEAMKMQNELRAPRDGTIDRVAVATGRTIEVGDLLLVIA